MIRYMQSFGKEQKLARLPVFPNKKSSPTSLRLFNSDKLQELIVISKKDIETLPTVKLTEDFRCLEGWVVEGVVWEGVNVSQLLRKWGKKLDYRKRFLLFGSRNFTSLLSRKKAYQKTTILATKMYGRRLTPAHGGPLRLVFRGHKCYESIKSVDRIVMLEKPIKTTARFIATSRIARKQKEA